MSYTKHRQNLGTELTPLNAIWRNRLVYTATTFLSFAFWRVSAASFCLVTHSSFS